MANEKQIIDEVRIAVDGLTETFRALSEVVATNQTQQADMIQKMTDLRKSLGNSKELKDFLKVQKDLETQHSALSKKQADGITLKTKEDILQQQLNKTTDAALVAAEKLTQAKIRTAQAQDRQSVQQQKAKKASDEASRAYVIQSTRLREATKAAQDAAAAYGMKDSRTKALIRTQQQMDAQIKKIDASLGIHNRSVGNYGRALQGVTGKLLGAFGIVGGIQMFANALRNATTLVKDYESANAELAGVLGTGYKETENLRKESQRLGKETRFTAKDVTKLQIELARMGKTEAEIIEMTEGIISASIALRSDTGETATLVAATLNAFQLEAGKSSHVADVLTLSTQRSALSFEKLNNALPTVAGAARAAGYSLEQTVAMLGQAADRGIDASTSATALRNIFMELAKSGMTLDEALNEINTSQNKLSTANELFGKRSAVTALALADTTDKTKELTYALENAGGTAQQVAETQMNTLEGRLAALNSAYEGLVITIAEGQTSMGAFVNDSIEVLTKFLQWLSSKEDEFSVKTYSENVKAMTQEGLEWEKKALEKHIDTTTKMYNEDLLARAASINNFQRKAAFFLKSKNYDILPEGFTGNVMTYLSMLQKEYNTLVEVKSKLNIVTKALNGESLDEEEIITELEDATEELVKVETDLIKIQEELLKQTREMPAATELELKIRNRRIEVIEKEIKRLRELGSIPEVKPLDFDKELKMVEDNIKELDKLDQIEIDKYLEKEKRKTEILEEETKLRQESERAAADFGIAVINGLFDRKQEKYNQDLEANRKYYDGILANEVLDEEQRALLEAQREERENQIKERQRELEKKQFLFNKGIKIAEILMDAAQKVAAIKATASVLAATPATYALAGLALAQIPLVKMSAAFSVGTVLAQSLPAFWKGTDHSPEGMALVGEKGTELVIEPDKKTAWLTDNEAQMAYLKKGSQVVTHDKLMQAVSNYTNNQIINSGEIKKEFQTKRLESILSQLLTEQGEGNRKMIKALSGNRSNPVNTIDRQRTELLRKRLSS